jgi:hypothetical protein
VKAFILAFLFVVNLLTRPGTGGCSGHLWLGIAWVFALFRVIRTVAVAGGLAALAAILLRRR